MSALLRPLVFFLLLMAVAFAQAPRSPGQPVFQWMATTNSEQWSNGYVVKPTAYLWVPPAATKLRGLLVLCQNVPEQYLSANEEIRKVCAERSLGIVYFTPSFWYFAKFTKGQDAKQIALLDRMLKALADASGFSEIETIPWLPIAESGHLLMAVGLVNERPERCIASLCVKNPQYPTNRTVPMIQSLGTAQEWGQTNKDVTTDWVTQTSSFQSLAGERKKTGWPVSVLIEPATGHFHCTDRMAKYIAHYISEIVKRRLPARDGDPLVPVRLEDGVIATLPLPGVSEPKIVPYDPGADGAWYPDESLAKEAQALAETDWTAATQLMEIEAVSGATMKPWFFNSIHQATVECDGTFELRGRMLDAVPSSFHKNPGTSLAITPGQPVIEWQCGAVATDGGGVFRIELDRTWKSGGIYLIAKKEGGKVDGRNVRFSLQPIGVNINENKQGADQRISFDPIADVPAGTMRIPLSAKSDSGLPVRFFVQAGPAVIKDGAVEITEFPRGAKGPVEVTVAAWQWGKASEPKVKAAEIVRRTFKVAVP